MAAITSGSRRTAFGGFGLLAALAALALAYLGATRAWDAQAQASKNAAAGAAHMQQRTTASALPATDARASVQSPRREATRPHEPATETERLLQVERSTQALDARFAGEASDGAWSHAQSQEIARFFAPESLAAMGVGTPADLRVDCRSRSCSVSGRFGDEVEAEYASQRLAMHLAAQLPYGAVMPRRAAGGGIEVNAWYSTAPLTP